MKTLVLGLLDALLLYAAWIDLKSLRIPNFIPVLIVLLFPIFAVVSGIGWGSALLNHATAGLSVFAIGFIGYMSGKIGGGDIKLLSVVALWLGWTQLAPGLLLIGLCGLPLCMAVLAARATALPVWLELRGFQSAALIKGNGVPYAVAIASGFILLQFFTA